MDPYIDYDEVSVYGRYFYRHSESLIGLSELVAVPKVRVLVLTRTETVETEYQLVAVPRSAERTGRSSVGEASDEMREGMRRYYFFLQSLPASVRIDPAAFFASGKLGRISQQKPEDLLSQADGVLRGFAVPASAALPEAEQWRRDLTAARNALDAAIHGKLGAVNGASASTGSLIQARESFLVAYNKVAKPLIRGLLAEFGREHEMRRYFRDLQVNEGRASRGNAPDEPAGDENDGTVAA